MHMLINGIGLVGGFGQGAAALLDALNRAELKTSLAPVSILSGETGIPAFLAETAGLEAYIPRKSLRRVDHFSRMALLGACQALEDAGRLAGSRAGLGVIIATGHGPTQTTFAFLDSVVRDGDQLASPTYFSSSVHNAAAAHISILLQASGPSLTVSQFEMSVASALLTARQWLAEGRADAVLLGAVDEYCPVLGHSWLRMFGNRPPEAMRPLEFESQTAIPGEGAAFFHLTRTEDAFPPGAYAVVSDVCMGRLPNTPGPGSLSVYDAASRNHEGDARECVCHLTHAMAQPDGTLFILGADGHVRCGKDYPRILKDGCLVAAYAPLYGSLPVGPAFDMAVAALTLKQGTIFRQPGESLGQHHLQSIPEHLSLGAHGIHCLKLGPGREFALVALARAAASVPVSGYLRVGSDGDQSLIDAGFAP